MNNEEIIYVYDSSFDGLLSAVHTAYYSRENPKLIMCENECQQELFCGIKTIETNKDKATAVREAVLKKISPNALFNIYRAHLSNDINRATMIFNYLKIGFNMGARVDLFLSNKWVSDVKKTAQRVSREACRMREFVRFSQMDNGVMFSQIEPDNNVLELICPYFVDRLYQTPWVICDARRSLAAIYDGKTWLITPFDTKKITSEAQDEKNYQKLWKTFYDTISIEGRTNERQRMGCMPKKYWKNMTEFKTG